MTKKMMRPTNRMAATAMPIPSPALAPVVKSRLCKEGSGEASVDGMAERRMARRRVVGGDGIMAAAFCVCIGN